MGYFAKVENGIVKSVIVVNDEDCGTEQEGIDFIASLGFEGTWIKTCKAQSIRKNYAGIGMTYDSNLDMFITESPHPSWTLDGYGDWQAPSPKPEGDYYWDEETLAWIAV
jgi:hypothetical protein